MCYCTLVCLPLPRDMGVRGNEDGLNPQLARSVQELCSLLSVGVDVELEKERLV